MGSKERSLLGDKKAQTAGGFIAWFFVIIVLLAAAIFFLIMNKVWGEVSPNLESALNESVPESDRETVINTLDDTSSGVTLFDKLFPFLLIGLIGFVLVLAGSMMDSPVMLFVGFIIMAVVVFIAVIFANIYNDISTSEQFTETNDQLPIQNKFMEYLPTLGFLLAIGVGIAIMVRRSGSRGGNY